MRLLKVSGLGFTMLLASAWVADSQAQQAAPAGGAPTTADRTARPRVNSPEILSDNRVTFRLLAPKASEVLVNGEWPGGRGMRMTKDASGVWSVTTERLSPEIWSYTFSVDGVTMLDPGNYHAMRDGSRYLSPVLISGEGSALYQTAKVPHGTVSAVWYPSPVLKADRRLLVYTPAGYEGSTTRYPTMYLFHGGSADEEAWNMLGVFNVILDNLIAQGKAKPMIVVLPNAYWNEAAVPDVGAVRVQPSAASGTGVAGQNYEQAEEDIVKGMVPFIEKRFRALTGARESRYCGPIHGRRHRHKRGIEAPGCVCVGRGVQFRHVRRSGRLCGLRYRENIAGISEGFRATNKNLKLLYFSCGTEDPRMPFQTKAADDLRARGNYTHIQELSGRA